MLGSGEAARRTSTDYGFHNSGMLGFIKTTRLTAILAFMCLGAGLRKDNQTYFLASTWWRVRLPRDREEGQRMSRVRVLLPRRERKLTSLREGFQGKNISQASTSRSCMIAGFDHISIAREVASRWNDVSVVSCHLRARDDIVLTRYRSVRLAWVARTIMIYVPSIG